MLREASQDIIFDSVPQKNIPCPLSHFALLFVLVCIREVHFFIQTVLIPFGSYSFSIVLKFPK